MLRDTLISLTGISTATQQSLMQITTTPELMKDAKTPRSLSKSIKSLTKSIETMKSLVAFYENKIQEEVGKTRVTRHMESAKSLVDSFRAVQEEDKQRGRTTLTRRQTTGGQISGLETSCLQTIANDEREAISRADDIAGTSDVNARVSAKIADILRERGEDGETIAEYILATPTFTNPVVADENHTSSPSHARSTLHAIVPAPIAIVGPVDRSDDEETIVGDTVKVICVKTLRPRPAMCATMPARRRTSGRVLNPVLETPCPREDGSNRQISFSSLVAGIVKT
jgi:hypothetical protein